MFDVFSWGDPNENENKYLYLETTLKFVKMVLLITLKHTEATTMLIATRNAWKSKTALAILQGLQYNSVVHTVLIKLFIGITYSSLEVYNHPPIDTSFCWQTTLSGQRQATTDFRNISPFPNISPIRTREQGKGWGYDRLGCHSHWGK